MLKHRFARQFSRYGITVLFLFFIVSAIAEESQIPVRVIDKEQGEKNVKAVAEQLTELMIKGKRSPSVLTQKKPYLKVIKGADDRSTLIYQCRNNKAESLVSGLESIVSTTGTVEQAVSQNLIIVNDLSSKIEELRTAVLAMDVNPPQVLVEAKIVEILTSDGVERDLRVMFQKFNQDLNLTTTGGMVLDAPKSQLATSSQGTGMDFYPYKSGRIGDDWKKLNVAVKWLLSAQDAKILSSPNLIVNIGTTAGIVTGEDIPIQSSQVVSGTINTSIEFKRVGVKLNVTPKMIDGKTIHLEVNPEVSQVTRYENFVQGETTFRVPVIAIRNINTELTLTDGDVVMLGGLYSSLKSTLLEKPPILGDIPYIGNLFSSQTTNNTLTQLIFFLKINIIKTGPDYKFYDPGKQAAEIQKIGEIIHDSGEIFPKKSLNVLQKMGQDIFGEENMKRLKGKPEEQKQDKAPLSESDADRAN